MVDITVRATNDGGFDEATYTLTIAPLRNQEDMWDATGFDSASLSSTALTWYNKVLAAHPVEIGWRSAAFDGSLYNAARNLWFAATGGLSAFLATGSVDMLAIVADYVELIFDWIADVDADGFRELIYTASSTGVSESLIGTDNGMDYNMLAAWLTTAGYAFDHNRTANIRFGTLADAIETWLLQDYLPETQVESPTFPLIPDDLFHCYARGALWLHMLEKWLGYGDYSTWLNALKSTVFTNLNASLLSRANGSLVWDHRPVNTGSTLGLHPSVYAADTFISLVLLALEGAIDDALLPAVAKTITLNIFPGAATFDGAYDVGGGVVLEGEPFNPAGVGTTTLINYSRFRQAGFPALAAWDTSGIIDSLVAQTEVETEGDGISMPGWMVFKEFAERLP